MIRVVDTTSTWLLLDLVDVYEPEWITDVYV